MLLFDEPETYLHPEWSRQMISNIVKIITELYGQHTNWVAKCQILLTTHTPYLLSDLLPCFVKTITNMNGKISIQNGNNSFAGNIYDILSSNFFVNNPIGKFAELKLNQIIKLKDNGTDVKKYRQLIENVGDEYLKKQLKRILEF